MRRCEHGSAEKPRNNLINNINIKLIFNFPLQKLSEEVGLARSRARDVVSTLKRLRRESGGSGGGVEGARGEELQGAADATSRRAADRLAALETTAPLATELRATHAALDGRLTALEAELAGQQAAPPAVGGEQIRQQQDAVKVGGRANAIPRTRNADIIQLCFGP